MGFDMWRRASPKQQNLIRVLMSDRSLTPELHEQAVEALREDTVDPLIRSASALIREMETCPLNRMSETDPTPGIYVRPDQMIRVKMGRPNVPYMLAFEITSLLGRPHSRYVGLAANQLVMHPEFRRLSLAELEEAARGMRGCPLCLKPFFAEDSDGIGEKCAALYDSH